MNCVYKKEASSNSFELTTTYFYWQDASDLDKCWNAGMTADVPLFTGPWFQAILYWGSKNNLESDLSVGELDLQVLG